MKTTVSITWTIRSLWTAIVRHAAQAVARITDVRRENTACTIGTAGRQTVLPAGRPYANRRRLPFLKYAPYTARDGISMTPPYMNGGTTKRFKNKFDYEYNKIFNYDYN